MSRPTFDDVDMARKAHSWLTHAMDDLKTQKTFLHELSGGGAVGVRVCDVRSNLDVSAEVNGKALAEVARAEIPRLEAEVAAALKAYKAAVAAMGGS